MRIDELHMGIKDKLAAVKNLATKYGVSMNEIAYIGDDINDLPVLEAVGLYCCPKGANVEIKSTAKYITSVCGGGGVVKEVADMIIRNM